jgi:CubicO group peptidase (beta-lactamase class C family)
MTIWSLLLLTTTGAHAGDPSCPDDGYWPAASWPDRTEDAAAMRPDAIAALDAYLFDPSLDRGDRDRRGVRTDGVVIVHRGAVVYERYGGGYDRDTRHLAWSATKTFTNALVGVAVREGLVSLDDSVCEHLTAPDEAACVVTVQHLLEFASGFDWRETYEGVSPTASSVLAMLYGEGHADMASFVLGHPLRDPPGTCSPPSRARPSASSTASAIRGRSCSTPSACRPPGSETGWAPTSDRRTCGPRRAISRGSGSCG